jgi:hypothetical protein
MNFTFEESLKLLKVMHQFFFILNCQLGRYQHLDLDSDPE